MKKAALIILITLLATVMLMAQNKNGTGIGNGDYKKQLHAASSSGFRGEGHGQCPGEYWLRGDPCLQRAESGTL